METPLTKNIGPDREPMDIKEYEAAGGYQALRKALKMSPQEIQDEVTKSNLRGRGGAGFKSGQKWSFLPMGVGARRPKYLVVNADEMEPGTFKDRLLLEGDPHQVIEGIIISAYALEADIAYIFIRWAYRVATKRLEQAIQEAYQHGYLGKDVLGSGCDLELYVHASAGRYMCGQEDGLLDALEGRRAVPRTKPPYPQVCGLWGKPTITHNVETLCCIPHIVAKGSDWFMGLSNCDCGGTKLYGVSGRVKKPGLWELPMGTTLRDLLEVHAGGMLDGYKFRALLPGGASTDFLLEEHLDVKLDFGSMEEIGSRMGTGTIIILDDKTCPVGMVRNLEAFFARESCGWCTPCREGLPWIADVLNEIESGRGQDGDIEFLQEQTQLLAPGHTFCALAPGAMAPLQTAIKHFRGDFEQHIAEHRCPWD